MNPVAENVDLFPYNTFGIHALARYMVTVASVDEVREAFGSTRFHDQLRLILGGGSNVLLTQDFPGLVIRNGLKGISVVEEDDDHIQLKVASGENWHAFVMYCVDRNFGGIENLSLIPGTVGAAPMQNIGAYGVEIKNVINSVEGINIETGSTRIFDREACAFGYRESVFKHQLRGKYFISSITLTLTKRNHQLNVSYGAIRDVLKERGIGEVTIQAVSEAVIAIRQRKLPDPSKIGNAGSFFKNPVIDAASFVELKRRYPEIPSYQEANDRIKIPAAWLIEQCGWKGKTLGNIGVHKNQALVLVNYGNGDGKKIWQLALDIQSSVRERFDIALQPEVNVV